MESINTRIRKLRHALQMSQEQFGKILGISKSGVCDIEAGRRRVTEPHILLLTSWKDKKIREQWLRTGIGDMFDAPAGPEPSPERKDELIQIIAEICLKLDSASRSALKDAICAISDVIRQTGVRE